jgi:hypothetical protein
MFDLLFAAAGLTGMAGLIVSGYRGGPAIPPSPDPVLKSAALVVVLVIGWFLAVQSTRLDQKLADDFLYRVLTKSAFISMMAIIFVAVLWQILLVRSLGGLTENAMLGVLVAVWSLSYFQARFRGTGA